MVALFRGSGLGVRGSRADWRRLADSGWATQTDHAASRLGTDHCAPSPSDPEPRAPISLTRRVSIAECLQFWRPRRSSASRDWRGWRSPSTSAISFARQLTGILAVRRTAARSGYDRCGSDLPSARAERAAARRRDAPITAARRGVEARARRRPRRRSLQSTTGAGSMSAPQETARAIRDAVAAGSRSARDVCRGALDRIRDADRQLNAFRYVDEEGAMARAARDRRPPRPTCRLCRCSASRWRSRTTSARRRMPTTAASRVLERLRPALRRDGRRAARGRRRGHRRQDQLRRVRDGVVDRELGVRRHAQSVESRADSRRLERWIGGGGRRRAGAARARLGHRRLDPAAGRALRRRSA